MSNSNKEYQLLKTICHTGKINSAQCDPSTIESLINKGLHISLDGTCYKLDDPITLLSETKIRSGLTSEIDEQLDQLRVIYETNSTNQAIHTLEYNGLYNVIISEYQSHGQGRREKKWSSPLAANVYLSIQLQVHEQKNSHFIPLITAMAVCNALSKLGVKGCQIKWPNDIYLQDRKLGGILVESRINSEKAQLIVIGIGLNVNMEVNSQIDQHWTSVRNNQNNIFDRNLIVATLLSETFGNYNQLSQFDFVRFKRDWSSRDYLKGKHIQVIEENDNYPATVIGIADDGALVIECLTNNQKTQKTIYSAEVSVKPIDTQNIAGKGTQ